MTIDLISSGVRQREPGGRIVLIVDDDPATRRMVSATLASDQYSVLQATDGQAAWRLIREHRAAVVILDWQMPVYTGLELTDVYLGRPAARCCDRHHAPHRGCGP